MRHAITKLAGALFCIGACAAAPVASALPITLLDTTFDPGAGYGIDSGANGENGGTLLDVFFSGVATPQDGRLANKVGDWLSFDLGTVYFREQDLGRGANLGIGSGELDLLGVGATLSFAGPLETLLSVTGTGKATAGSIGDADVDFLLQWDPVQMAFGDGGLLELRLEDLRFSSVGEYRPLQATMTVLETESERPQLRLAPTSVPEPATLALFALGLAAVAWLRGRSAARGRPGAKLPEGLI